VSVVAVCADKGRPGVTTTALALAAAWPRRAAVAELDPSGGDLALRLADAAGRLLLSPAPGLLTWAATFDLAAPARSPLWEHCQTVGGLPVLAGLAGGDQAGGLAGLWPRLAAALSATGGGDVLADLGRWQPGSPVAPVAAAADLVVVVTTGTLEGLVHTRDRVRALLQLRRTGLGVVVVASDRDGPRAVDAARAVLDHDGLPARVAGFVAADAAGVRGLQRGDRSARQARSLLARSAREVAAALAGWLPAAGSAPSQGDPAHAPAGRSRRDAGLAGSAQPAGRAGRLVPLVGGRR
jgi:MinD-like ATPase involved in chromosome partitioning or flagellar assembly